VLIFFIAGLLYLLRLERVDNLGAYSIPSATGLLIPSVYNSWQYQAVPRPAENGVKYASPEAAECGMMSPCRTNPTPNDFARESDELLETAAKLIEHAATLKAQAAELKKQIARLEQNTKPTRKRA
jgi:hypothetical protein